MCTHIAGFTDVSILNKTNLVMFEAVCQCAVLHTVSATTEREFSVSRTTTTACLWLKPTVARKSPACCFFMLLLEQQYQSRAHRLIPQTGLAGPLLDGKDRSSQEGHIYLVESTS